VPGMRVDIVAVGVACLDYAVAVRSLEEGERIAAARVRKAGGGMAATAMVAAQRLGARCALASAVGMDEAGRFVLAELREAGLDVRYVRRRRGCKTSQSLCLAETRRGRKLIIGLCGGCRPLTPRDVDRQFWEMLAGAKVLHLDGTHADLALAAARKAREMGLTVALDATTVGPQVDDFLANCDVVFASQTFLADRFGQAAGADALDALAALTPARWVGITMGEAGSVALDRRTGRRFYQPAFEVEVVDTVGAGDAYHGAISFALARGWPLARAMRLAAAVGALCCTGLSGRECLPTMNEVRRFVRRAGQLRLHGPGSSRPGPRQSG